jgi:membrane-bound lytic murein transglycosylase B
VALAGVRLDSQALRLDRAQPDGSNRPVLFNEYLAAKFRGDRVARGRRLLEANSVALAQASAQSGVPAHVIAAVWGIETSYGRVTGDHDLVAALATLAYDGRRRALFERELDAAVRMVGEGHVARGAMRGSWAGAFGQLQFLPSSYLSWGRDGDGDGRVDVWRSLPDVYGSIGAYLGEHGWRGQQWGFAVVLPLDFDRSQIANDGAESRICPASLKRHSRQLTASQWQQLGIVSPAGAWPGDDVPLSLIEPDGPGGNAWLTTPAFRALLSYNCSNYYAISLGMLADALGAP